MDQYKNVSKVVVTQAVRVQAADNAWWTSLARAQVPSTLMEGFSESVQCLERDEITASLVLQRCLL